MDLVGTDLHFDALAVRPDHRGVERLIQVRLGQGDVVLEPAGDRLPMAVDDPQDGIALGYRVDHDAECHQVIDLAERQVL